MRGEMRESKKIKYNLARKTYFSKFNIKFIRLRGNRWLRLHY